jgi:ATP-dependent Lon protease
MERITLLMASVRNNRSIPSELFAEFQTSFYTDTRDAAFKAMGVE